MSKLAIIECNEQDCIDMAKHIRKADKAEFVASHGHDDIELVMRENIQRSAFSYSARDNDGRLVCMFGAAPLGDGRAVAWLVSAKAIRFHKREFAVKCRKLYALFDGFDVILNWVDVRYTTSIRWLEWLGFNKTDEILKLNGVDFVCMERVN